MTLLRQIYLIFLLWILSFTLKAQSNPVKLTDFIDTINIAKIQESHLAILSEKIVREAYKRIDVAVLIHPLPGERALLLSSQGERIHGELHRLPVISQKFPSLLQIPVPIIHAQLTAFTSSDKLKKHPELNNLEKGWNSLIGFKVGTIRGVRRIQKELIERGFLEKKMLFLANKPDQLYKMLRLGRIDVVVANVTFHLLPPDGKEQLGDQLVALSPPLDNTILYHFVHEKFKPYVTEITNAFKELEAENFIRDENAKFF